MRNLIALSDFRTAYSTQLGDVDLQAARAMHAFLSSFDDHEIRNEWVYDRANWKLCLEAEDPDSPPPELFLLTQQAGKIGRARGRDSVWQDGYISVGAVS